ncbi:MAG: threonine synthase [candidate division WOR-3 bacterium]
MGTDRLFCIECGKSYAVDEKIWRCECGGLLDLELAYEFLPEKVAGRRLNLWRYREAIPIDDDDHIVSFEEGFTPLLPVKFGDRTVLIKQDHLLPTGSFKDRGASVLISKVKELGIKKVIIDSSGNAGCAVAAYCARAGIKCDVYVPARTGLSKIKQISAYGADLKRIRGSREATARAALAAAEKDYYASHYWNPFFFHGTKTFAFEICEQLGWQAPDTVILPVGNGTLLLGAFIGFRELYLRGIIEKVPRIIGVQSKNCAPLARAFAQKMATIPEINKKETVAEGIAISEPRRGPQIIDAVRKTRGDFVMVSDREIGLTLRQLWRRGFYVEPTAGAGLAGLKKFLIKQRVSKREVVVSIFTGHGLKSMVEI